MAEVSEAIDKSVVWGGARSPFNVSYGKMMMWIFLVSDALTFSGILIGLGFVRHAHTGHWPIGEETFQSLPFLSGSYPLIYVAFMTFLLIISSVTMVLAVEAGHRRNEKQVIKWLGLTILGGIFFLSSQAWEWKHFIEGSGGYITTADDSRYYLTEKIPKGQTAADVAGFSLIANKGTENETLITGQQAVDLYNSHVNHVWGANPRENEYGPPAYGGFFFFITGFHGFHVFTGLLVNITVFVNIFKGTYRRRGHYEMVEKAGLYWHFIDLVWVFVFTFFYLI